MNKKYRKRKLPRYFFIISLALFLFVGIGYSVINSNLSMQGNVVRKATTWNIGFDNPVFDTESISSPTPTITNGTTMTMNVTLTNPGDIYAFTVDLKNTGSVPALINTLTITELTEEQQKYLRWKVEYEDESTPSVGDVLKAGETKKLHIYLEYKKLRATDLYPTSNVNLTLTITANFILPEETLNTVTLTKNGSTKLIQVSNLEQEVTLTDFPIESTDQVIACNNGVEPSTDVNDKIVLSKVKQNATCRIEQSLASAVTNSSAEVTNMAILQDAEFIERIVTASNQIINIDLNGKTTNIDNSKWLNGNIDNNGILNINGEKANSNLIIKYGILNEETGSINLVGGSYSVSFSTSGKVNARNVTLENQDTGGLFQNTSNMIVSIEDSIIKNHYFRQGSGETLIKNSTIIYEINSAIFQALSDDEKMNFNFCNVTIERTNPQADFYLTNKSAKVFYDNNTMFSTGTTPTCMHNTCDGEPKKIIKTELACAE